MKSGSGAVPPGGGGGRGVRGWQLWRAVGGVLAACGLAYTAFLLRLNLSSAGSLELLLVVVAALQWGLVEATAISVASVMALNFLFIAPLFRLTVADPVNWVSLLTFEATALLVSRLSAQARASAVEADRQKLRATKLYELSRAILLIDQRRPLEEQLAALIREIIEVEDVELSLHGDERSVDARGRYTLRLGATATGWMRLDGWEEDARLAEAVASLAAIAVERARAVQRESRADSERDTERLRMAVLDGLAHGFKTPLTAIQTASSGLLAIGQTDATQAELVSLIDEQATLLNEMTTKLLRTASLERREVRLARSRVTMGSLVEEVVAMQARSTRQRISVSAGGMEPCMVDAELVKLALTQLVDNAAKYSGIGESIRVSVRQSEEEVTVVVASAGVPIRAEEIERIFERFYRGSNVMHGPAGTGLGLSIVKQAAAAHGGRVFVQVQGPLTEFFFIVPR